jgi:hypothetical protein
MDIRGEYRFSSRMKQNKKAKICFVIYIAGFFFLKFFCYEVIVKQKIYKRCRLYYLCVCVCVCVCARARACACVRVNAYIRTHTYREREGAREGAREGERRFIDNQEVT